LPRFLKVTGSNPDCLSRIRKGVDFPEATSERHDNVLRSKREKRGKGNKEKKGFPYKTGRGGLYGCEKLRISYYLDNLMTDGGKVVNPTHRPSSTPQKHYFSASGTHFC
jgi:hypothetical protein